MLSRNPWPLLRDDPPTGMPQGGQSCRYKHQGAGLRNNSRRRNYVERKILHERGVCESGDRGIIFQAPKYVVNRDLAVEDIGNIEVRYGAVWTGWKERN